MNSIRLNTGAQMPVLGLGVYKMPAGPAAERIVASAIEIGYRLIDTAALYGNEQSVGNALRASSVPRADLFVTTKLHTLRFWNIEAAFNESLRRLRLEYVDLYLIHWPFLRTTSIWRALQALHKTGRARAIGVSNFRIKDLDRLPGVVPAVNQVEFHPFLYRRGLLEHCGRRGIVLEAHSPLTHGKRLDDSRVRAIAERYGRSPAQILIRWSLQHGVVVVAKTLRVDRLRENADVFDFALSDADMAALTALNANYHVAGLSRLIGDPS